MDDDFDDTRPTKSLEVGRWPILRRSFEAALCKEDTFRVLELILCVEIELGLRKALDLNSSIPRLPEDILELLSDIERNHAQRLPLLMPRLERALAASPMWWFHYVDASGFSTFDPVELGASAGVARHYARSPKEHRRVVRVIRHCWDMLLGQRPLPEIREHPRSLDPTLVVQIAHAIERVQLNWRSLGLRPVIDDHLVVRHDPTRGWIAWVSLARAKSGKVHPHAVLLLGEDNRFRLVRRPD